MSLNLQNRLYLTFWTSVDSQTKDMRSIESFKKTLQSRYLK